MSTIDQSPPPATGSRRVPWSTWALVGVAVVVVGVGTGVGAWVQAEPGRGFWFTPRWSALTALLGFTVVAAVLDKVVRNFQAALPDGGTAPSVRHRRDGIKALVIGTDGRASTSKLHAVLWTVAVLFVFTLLLFAGHVLEPSSACAPNACGAGLRDALDKNLAGGLSYQYIALLGLPLGAAVASKAVVTNKVANKRLVKTPVSDATSGVGAGLAEIVTNDRGEADTLDFQYAAFNAFTLVYFFVHFATNVAAGLPTIPETLLLLSGVSSTAYVTKKALETSAGPRISTATPSHVVIGLDGTLDLHGDGFIGATGRPTQGNEVLLDGRPLEADGWTTTSVRVRLPRTPQEARAQGLPSADRPRTAHLVVRDDVGNTSERFAIELSEAPQPEPATLPAQAPGVHRER